MTRKDYIKFAALLASYKADPHSDNVTPVEVAEFLTLRIADLFAEDNERFDRARFVEAAGLKAEAVR